MDSSARARLLASSDRESLLNSSSLTLFNNPFHKQKQLGNYFSDNIFLVDEWHTEEYLTSHEENKNGDATWRLKERMKTAGVALVICLNIGIDPPDVVKPSPCARKECWYDPVGPKQKGLEVIGNALQQQYEKWQSKAKYKQCLDPTSEELRRICINLRKNSRNDRLLLHYNGHGVPRPTKNGELWVFGKHYTHYTPVAICELRSWLGDPAIYVLDCSGAGILIPHLVDNVTLKSSTSHGFDLGGAASVRAGGASTTSNTSGLDGPTIVLAACKANEILPMNPQYPADVFTACLTTPIVIAIRWFVLQNPYSMRDVNPDIAENIPGKDNDRKTPRGELNWIFTAITDTIAWNTLPSKTFQKMFRQDLLVASLFRNFLLAKRIMKSFGCTPQSWPQLPDSTTHALWQSWDLTLESFITHNVALARGSSLADHRNNMSFLSSGQSGNSASSNAASVSNLSFFTDQLTAFELWLDFGQASSEPPAHLPIVLQVLLSQTHRLRALLLLKRYLALGPDAVNLSLMVGIFPYILKLLQSPADDIKQILVSIWASIIGFDASCRQELVREKAQSYFIQYLVSAGMPAGHRCLSAFVLAEICSGFKEGQQTCLQLGLHRSCTSILSQADVLASGSLKRWVCLCLYKLCEDFLWAKYLCITEAGHTQLYPLLADSDPTVRAAAVLGLGEIFGASALHTAQLSNAANSSTPNRRPQDGGAGGGAGAFEEKDLREAELQLALQILECCTDGAVVVRLEAVYALSKFFTQHAHLACIKIVAKAINKRNYDRTHPQHHNSNHNHNTSGGAHVQRKSISPSVEGGGKINLLYPWHLSAAESRDVTQLVEDYIERNGLNVSIAAGGPYPGGAQGQLAGQRSSSLFEEQSYQQQQHNQHSDAKRTNSGSSVPGAAERAISLDDASTPALSTLMASSYVRLWLALTEVHGKDPCSAVAAAAGIIRSRILALVLIDERRVQQAKHVAEHGGVDPSRLITIPDNMQSYQQTAFSASFASPFAQSPFLAGAEHPPPPGGDARNMSMMYGAPPLSPLGVVGSNTNPFGSPSTRHKNIKTGTSSSGAAKSIPRSSPFLNSDGAAPTTPGISMPRSSNTASGVAMATGPEVRKLQSSSPGPSASASFSMGTPSMSSRASLSEKFHAFTSVPPYLDEPSTRELAELPEEELMSTFSSGYYDLTKRVFLAPDLGFDPYTDPLSSEGRSRTYRNAKQLEIVAHEAYLAGVFREVDERSSETFLLTSSGSISGGDKSKSGANAKSNGSKHNADDIDSAVAKGSAVASLPVNVTKFEQKAILTIENAALMPSLVMFHAFQDVLAVCDGTSVGIWSLATSSRIMEIKNKTAAASTSNGGSRRGSAVAGSAQESVPIFTPLAAARVTAMAWINESYDALLLLGSDDGVVKVWRDTSSSDVIATHLMTARDTGNASIREGGVNGFTVSNSHGTSAAELASTFSALPDVAETSRGSGIVLSWRQASGILAVGGNSSSVRLWDLGREQCTRVFHSGSDTCLTAMATMSVPGSKFNSSAGSVSDYHSMGSGTADGSNEGAAHMSWIFAGFADGSIGAFDERVYTNGGRVHSARDHSAWIISAHLRADVPEVVTASVRGTVKFWDLRTLRTYKTLEVQKSPLTALAVHNCAPIMATGSHAQFIKVLTLGGEQLGNIIKYHDGFLGQRIGPVSCLAFHPHRMMLAASFTDSIVSIYSTAENNSHP